MIRALRKRHLWMIVVVGAVAGALFVLALAVRPAPPLQDELPVFLEGLEGLEEAAR